MKNGKVDENVDSYPQNFNMDKIGLDEDTYSAVHKGII